MWAAGARHCRTSETSRVKKIKKKNQRAPPVTRDNSLLATGGRRPTCNCERPCGNPPKNKIPHEMDLQLRIPLEDRRGKTQKRLLLLESFLFFVSRCFQTRFAGQKIKQKLNNYITNFIIKRFIQPAYSQKLLKIQITKLSTIFQLYSNEDKSTSTFKNYENIVTSK